MKNNSVETLVKTVTALAQSAQVAGTLTSAAIDTAGFGDILVLFPVGGVGSSGTFTGLVHDSDASGSGFAALTGAAFPFVVTATVGPQGSATGTGDDKCYSILLRQGSHKRYIKVLCTVATATMVGGVGAIVQLFAPQDSALNPSQLLPASGEGIAAVV